MTSVTEGRVELRQSTGNALQMPVFIAVILVAIVVSQTFAHQPSATVYAVCAVFAVLDVVFAAYVLRNTEALLVVTAADITFTRRRVGRNKTPGPRQVITRAPDSSLTFRMGANGPVGSQHTGYVLKLRDTATGQEVYAGAFGRGKVQQACRSQGWRFS